MSQRLSRKEIKRDEFMESIGGALSWVQDHSRMLLAGAAAVVAVLILVVIYLGYADRREKRADSALAKAMQVYQSAVDPVAANPDDPKSPTFPSTGARSQRAAELFQGVMDDFGSSEAAGIATAYMAQISMADGNAAEARANWEEFLAKSSDHMLTTEVQINLMALDRAEGRGDELVTRLRAMLSGPDEGLPADLLWYQLALTLEGLDRDGEAREAYQRIVDDFPRSSYAPVARERAGGGQAPLFGT